MIEVRDTTNALLLTLDGDDLHHRDLRRKSLRGANLARKNLSNCDLSDADLSGADLTCAYLKFSVCYRTSFKGAILTDAYFGEATLLGADFTGAVGADMALILAVPFAIPASGSFLGWKRCQNGVLVQLEIPEGAGRTRCHGRECRAEFANVLQVIGADVGTSIFGDPQIEYRAGETVRAHEWNPNVLSHGGIHFWLSQLEAEQYGGVPTATA